jgi:hypothetical protein
LEIEPPAMTILIEVSQVPRPWLYWQKYPKFHGHDCTDKYFRSYGRYLVLKSSSCCQCKHFIVAFKHVQSVCRPVTESWPSSCLRIDGVSLCQWSLLSIWSMLSKLWIGAYEGAYVRFETAVCPSVVG